MISFKQLSHEVSAINSKIWIWIGLVVVAAPALRIYYVREMLAALIAFSLLFVAGSTAALTVFLLLRISKHIVVRATPNVGRVVRRGVDALEGVVASPVWAPAVRHSFRRERLKWNEKYKMVYLRFAGLKPNQVYRVGLLAGVSVRTIRLSVWKSVSSQFRNWQAEQLTGSVISLVRLSGSKLCSPQIKGLFRFGRQIVPSRHRLHLYRRRLTLAARRIRCNCRIAP